MTSGEFRFVPIDLIWVNPDERQRSKLDGVDRIAGSVRKRGGLINPPLLLAIMKWSVENNESRRRSKTDITELYVKSLT